MSNLVTPLDLDPLSKLVEAATPGPWRYRKGFPADKFEPKGYAYVQFGPTERAANGRGTDQLAPADARLIVAAVNALPDLIDRLKRAEAALSVERIAEALVPVLRCWPPAVSERELERDRRDMLEIAGRLLAALKGDSE